MKKLSIFLMMLCFACFGVANAQQSLPYSYGFENNNLSTDGWTSSGSYGAINSVAAKTGSYGFRFQYSSSDLYLMSPILSGGTYGVNVSFYYKAYSGSYLDHFNVGYTTDANVTDPSRFTYGSLVTSSTSWQEYTEALPAGTVRVAIKYDSDNYNDGWYLYLDDFAFTAASSCTAPTNASVTYRDGSTTATVTWSGSARSYNVEVNGVVDPNPVSGNSYTISNLAPATNYTVRVQADCGNEQSAWVNAGSFSTPCPTSFAIPHTYGFENTAEMDCWTMANIPSSIAAYTGLQTNDWTNANLGGNYARTGNNFFFFMYYAYTDEGAPFQTLISPELSGISRGLHVEFYYSGYSNGVETLRVGYSTTDNAVGSFNWGDEITATSSYQRFSANYPAGTKYVAVQHTSDDQYYLFLDDFLFEESASCLDPTSVTASNETTTGATIGWTAGGNETAWDLFITDDATIVPDENTTPTVANTASNPYTFTTELTPATNYYVYVRAICSGTDESAWSSPAIFHTECEGMSLPYTYDFDNGELSVCWSIINTNTSYTAINVMAPSSSSSNQVLGFYRGSGSGTLVAVLPEVDATYPLNGYQITFDACYANTSSSSMTAGKIGIGIMTDPTDFNTFTLIEEVNITNSYSTYASYNVKFDNYTGNGQYIAIQDIHTQNGYVLVDNIEVTALPCPVPAGLSATPTAASATLSWTGNQSYYNVRYRTVTLDDEPATTTEGFEHSGNMPDGWTKLDLGDGNNTSELGVYNSSNETHDGTYCFRFSSYNGSSTGSFDQYLISPELNNLSALSFYYRSSSTYTEGETFRVGYSTTTNDVSAFTWVSDETTSSTSYSQFTASNIPANAKYFAINYTAVYQYRLYIDDITYTYTPYVFGTWENKTNQATPLDITGLTPMTTYQWQVEGIDGSCSGDSDGNTGVTDWSAMATFTTLEGYIKTIEAYTGETDHYYLIASPVTADVTPAANNGFLTSAYDLYYFNQDGDSEGLEWINYEDTNDGGYDIENGKGYLYASSTNTTLVFAGTAYSGNGEVELTYSTANADATMHGWNLVGNPFAQTAYIDMPFYTLDGESEYQEHAAGDAINRMQGILVYTNTDKTLTFSTTNPNSKNPKLAVKVSRERSVIDRAIVNFGEGSQLPKFQLNPNHTKVYMPVDGKDYAVVNSEENGEMPVNFKAEKNGTYTLSFTSEEISFGYLHLIDNMTGNDVDLLKTPSYSFDAKTTDYESRFKLVFATGNNDDTFAFYSNGSFVINNEGNATLQVIDVNGRILKSESINGCANINVKAAAGVYMLRLVNGNDVKVQKVVVR